MSRHSGTSRMHMLLMCTMCRGAPVTAAAPMTSPIDSMKEPGSKPRIPWCSRTGAGPSHDTRRLVTGRRAVIDECLAAADFDEAGDVGHSGLEFQSRGDAVERLQAIGIGVLLMLMQVDESRSDHQAPNPSISSGAPDDARGMPVDGAVPDAARNVVAFITTYERRTAQMGTKCGEHRRFQDCGLVHRTPLFRRSFEAAVYVNGSGALSDNCDEFVMPGRGATRAGAKPRAAQTYQAHGADNHGSTLPRTKYRTVVKPVVGRLACTE